MLKQFRALKIAIRRDLKVELISSRLVHAYIKSYPCTFLDGALRSLPSTSRCVLRGTRVRSSRCRCAERAWSGWASGWLVLETRDGGVRGITHGHITIDDFFRFSRI